MISSRGGFAIRALAACALSAALCATSASAHAPALATGSSTGPGPYRPGDVIVGFDPGTSAATQQAAARRLGAAAPANGVATAKRLAPRIRLVRVHRGDVPAALRSIRGRRGVQYAEPDYLMTEAAVPNDASFGQQWALDNTGQKVGGVVGTPGVDDRVLPAWDVTTGDPSVVIGETDSGVDYLHPDLAANVWTNPGGIGGCPAGTHGYNTYAGNCDPMDDESRLGGHGTHVAGIMGAVGNNVIGVSGVNWNTTILPVKFTNSKGSGSTSALISALEWLVQAKQAGVNVRVVNDSQTYVGTAYSQALSDEIDRLGANDILFVTAAGNSGANNDDPANTRYPCGYDRPNEICVAAIDQKDRLPSWSNYGPNTVDLAAPGAKIYSTLRNDSYGIISGTSMASAEVSGSAALILANGYRSATDLKADILDNVDQRPVLAGKVRTGGQLDVCRAMPACFGKTTVGASSEALTADRKRVSRYSLPERATLRYLSVDLHSTTTSGSENITGVVYADAGGAPGALLGTTDQLTFSSGDSTGWYDLTLKSPLTLAAGNYWIGLISGGTSRVAAIRYDNVAGTRVYNTNTYSAGPSDPFGSSFTTDSRQMSLYAAFTSAP